MSKKISGTVFGYLSRRSFLALGGSAALVAAAGPVRGQTCVVANKSLSFLVVGDWGHASNGAANAGQVKVAGVMAAFAQTHGIDFVISTGDNFYPNGVGDVADSMFTTAFEEVYSAKSMQRPWYLVLGNHDRDGRPMAQVARSAVSERWNLPSPFYRQSMRLVGGSTVDMFFLDTTELIGRDKDQLDWLEQELMASRAAWKFVVGHHPVYSGGSHGNTRKLIKYVEPLLKKYSVQAYFNGHDHDLQHIVVGGINYFTSGGGSRVRDVSSLNETRFAASALGFLAVRLSAEEMLVNFVSADNEVLYTASIRPGRGRARVASPPRHAGG